MTDYIKHIEAFDCLPFENTLATANVLQEFIETQSKSIFYFSQDYMKDSDSVLAEYCFKEKKWFAGRFIGEAIFNYNNQRFKITIKPRFGDKVLFRMLEEIFNIKITKSQSENTKKEDWQHYIKRILAYIWLQKLANANLHGLPKSKFEKINKGQFIKGHLDIRNSILPYCKSGELISISREKQIDRTIAKIIGSAYSIIKRDFLNGTINIPDSAQNAINQINSSVKENLLVQEADYHSIRYKEIYLSWKPLVDFSWDIIKHRQFSLKQKNKSSNSLGFFIDMAEVWEQYLRSFLKKNLLPFGWRIKEEKIIAYKNYFFGGELIPDLVFQKESEIVIWDAKYKRMLGRPRDVDRQDFFQIHTYLQYFLKNKKVKAGGLIYPISANLNYENNISEYLLNEEGFNTKFSIDGIKMKEVIDKDSSEILNPEKEERLFIKRILNSIL